MPQAALNRKEEEEEEEKTERRRELVRLRLRVCVKTEGQ